MGHMPAPGRACLSLLCPPAHSVPTCLKPTSDNVQEQIYKLAKKDLTPSQIGVSLKDSRGVRQVLFFFLGAHSRHMQVPRLEAELQLPAYTTATATQDPS